MVEQKLLATQKMKHTEDRRNCDNEYGIQFQLTLFIGYFFSVCFASFYASVLFEAIVNWIAYMVRAQFGLAWLGFA